MVSKMYPALLRNANKLDVGRVLCVPFPLGLGCLCSVSGRPRCEELGIQNTWQQGMRSRPFGKD